MAFAVKGVRILLVGDDGVGKTSLILSLVTEEFPEEVPSRAEEITIPADVTPEKVPTHIVDFSYSEQGEDDLRQELELADVVCVVYAVDDDICIERITTYWLPIVFDVCGDRRKPVVLVGNKSDLVDEESPHMNKILTIMDDYPEVETCIECSACDLKNISELFYYAQKAVLHPTSPLYSHDEQQITEKCEVGLTRIFKICDMDNDGMLNDEELNEFQKRCFKNSLPPHGLQEVKSIVQRNMEGGVTEEGVTLPGFLFLHTLFIQKGRQETTWTALRRFGYGVDLELKEDYLSPNLQLGPDCSVELSSSGLDFIMELFYKYDKDEDDALSAVELDDLCSVCVERLWSEVELTASCRTSEGWITAEGFVAQWMLWTYINPSRTLRFLAYYGYIHGDMENQITGLRITRSKSIDIQKRKTTRSVFLVYVVGSRACGKTSFLQSFLGNNTIKEDKDFCKYSVNSVQVKRQEVHMILEEVHEHETDRKLASGKADCVCFLYNINEADSFSVAAALHKKLPDQTPSVFIGTKCDLSKSNQNYSARPNEYAILHSSIPLQYFSSMENNNNSTEIFTKIATLAVYMGSTSSSESSMSKLAISIGLSLLLAASVGFIAYRHIRKGSILSNG